MKSSSSTELQLGSRAPGEVVSCDLAFSLLLFYNFCSMMGVAIDWIVSLSMNSTCPGRMIRETRMMRLRSSWMLLMVCGALYISACGGGDDEVVEEPPPNPYPALAAAEPLDLAAVSEFGIGVRSGEALAFSINNQENYQRMRGTFSHAMYHVRSYDELTLQYGEYSYYSLPSSENPRSAIDFIQNPSLGLIDIRTDDLADEIEEASAKAAVEDFAKKSITVDLWRTNGEWYVRWDGLLDSDANTKGIGPYGFGRKEMTDDLLASLADVAGEHKPEYMIIGTDMERLWIASSGPDAHKGEWSAFIAFAQEAITRIKEASPSTRVGIGINWDTFVNEVAPEYAKLEVRGREGEEAAELDEALLDRAFRSIVLPLAEWGDVLALRSWAGISEDNVWRYQFLRRLESLYGVNPGIVYYGVGSPIDGSANAQQQRNYMESFAAWNAGVNVEAIFWESMLNVDGANGANQQIGGRCKSLVEDADKNFLLPRQRCFDGLFDSIFEAKPAFIFLEETLGE